MTGQPRVELTEEPRPVRPCARQDWASLPGGRRATFFAGGRCPGCYGLSGALPPVSKRRVECFCGACVKPAPFQNCCHRPEASRGARGR